MEKFRNLWKYAFVGGSARREAPEASENIQKLGEKSMKTCKP